MSINPVSSNQSPYPSGFPVNAKQIKTDFQNLTAALQSGDLATAQQAFAALQQDDPQVAKALEQSGQNGGSPQVNALQSLATALQSGDVKGAQTALTSLHQAMKGHRGHHHHAAAAPSSPAGAGVTGSPDASGGDDDSRATLLNAIV